MEKGVLAIFSEISFNNYDSVNTFVNYYNIPFLTWSYPNRNEENLDKKLSAEYNETSNENFLLNMHPNLAPILISLVKYNRWEVLYYFYDSDEALNRLEGLFDYQMKEIDFVTNILG